MIDYRETWLNYENGLIIMSCPSMDLDMDMDIYNMRAMSL